MMVHFPDGLKIQLSLTSGSLYKCPSTCHGTTDQGGHLVWCFHQPIEHLSASHHWDLQGHPPHWSSSEFYLQAHRCPEEKNIKFCDEQIHMLNISQTPIAYKYGIWRIKHKNMFQ